MNTQTTYVGYAPAADTGGIAGAVKRAVNRVLSRMMYRHIERQTLRELSTLPDYVLRDIGLSRGDIRGVAADLARDRSEAWARRAGASNGFGG